MIFAALFVDQGDLCSRHRRILRINHFDFELRAERAPKSASNNERRKDRKKKREEREQRETELKTKKPMRAYFLLSHCERG